jgi:nucleotide-binding universal stress UspA family protein
MSNLAMPRPIAVGIRGDEEAALAFAVAECRRSGAPLRLVHVVDLGWSDLDAMRRLRREPDFEEVVRRILNTAGDRARLLAGGEIEVEKVIRRDGAAHALIEESAAARLLVLEHKDRSRVPRFPIGSTVPSVAARAHCPVVAVPEHWRPAPNGHPVVVGLDDSGEPREALATAFAEASTRAASVLVVHAWKLDAAYQDIGPSGDLEQEWRRRAQPLLERAVAACETEYPDVKSVIELRIADPVDVLLHESEHASLLVLGRRARRSPLHIGSVTRTMCQASRCPVLVVPAPRAEAGWALDADEISPQT